MTTEEVIIKLGVDSKAVTSGLRNIKSSIEEWGMDIKRMVGGFFAGMISAEGLKSVLDFGENIKRTAEIAGTSTDFIQTLSYAMRQTGGSAETGERGIEKLNIKIGEAREKGGEAAEAFKKWGIAIDDASGAGRNTESIIRDIADRMKNAGSASERATIAFDLFGKTGQELIPILMNGAAGLDSFSDAATKLSEIDLENLAHAKQDLNDIGNQALIAGGKVISALANFSRFWGILHDQPVSIGGFRSALKEYQNQENQAMAREASAALANQMGSTPRINQMALNIEKEREKTAFLRMTHEQQYHFLLDKEGDLMKKIASGAGTADERAKDQLEVEKLEQEVQSKIHEITRERRTEEELITEQKKKQKEQSERIALINEKIAFTQLEKKAREAEPFMPSIEDLAQRGIYRRQANQLMWLQQDARLSRQFGNVGRAEFDQERYRQIRSQLEKSGALSPELTLQAMNEHMQSMQEHIARIIEKGGGTGAVLIVPTNGN